ncbi:hypothetical protein DBR43_31630 [Pedobacter sp. KBW06]|uniref:fasciclin domain-containing protein n=1 Tax=Pedobacter sp. KBW06 TaxID=2153359 RepID=UPI000F598E28|nr:fasciclin domain-containing protein [Pedobacter sp. KBW06]RQO64833.1 hypothetical protein DBR43_31630 [Pedobacter sp. KBW06]
MMNSKKSYHIFRAFSFLVFCAVMLLMASCRKDEFMPVPEGQIVPPEEAIVNLTEALNATPYSLFKAAWTRSTMDARLKTYGERTKFTLLVPTDAALVAEGMTLEVINNTPAEALDELLMYHTIASPVNPRDLAERLDNTMEQSILGNPALRVRPISPFNSGGSDPYFYRQYLKVQQGHLYINGKDAGNIQPIAATNGILWPIQRLLHKPTKTMLEALKEDGRFGIYLGVMEKSAQQWLKATGLTRLWTTDLIAGTRPAPQVNLTFSSILAPTDAAFHAAGFASADAVIAMNNQRPLPYRDGSVAVGLLASDDMLTLHRWSDLIYPTNAQRVVGRKNSTTFYSNDLNNDLLANYILRDGANNATLPIQLMPLEFGKTTNGAITIKSKGSTHAPAVVVDGDINTIMGPIHAVDHLIPIADFKF